MSEHPQTTDTVRTVYELREAAVEHGKAVAVLDADPSPQARDEVLATQTALEEKTAAALDECSDRAEAAFEAGEDAREQPSQASAEG